MIIAKKSAKHHRKFDYLSYINILDNKPLLAYPLQSKNVYTIMWGIAV